MKYPFQQEQEKFPLDPLMVLYHESVDAVRGLTHNDIVTNDITSVFWESIRDRVLHNALITITIRGETTSGKSTVALYIKHMINSLIVSTGKNNEIDEYKTICSDQIEFTRAIMKNWRNVCFSIDEWSELGKSGENATTENNLFTFYTDVCAQRYIHRVMCTPKALNQFDKASVILLDVLGRDDEKKETLCKVYYNDPSQLMGAVPLGTVKFEVGELIGEEWYLRYRRKKFARIDLLDKYGVKDVRELEISAMTLMAYERLKDMARASAKVPQELVETTTKHILQDEKLFYSILGMGVIVTRTRALLDLPHTLEKTKKKLRKPLHEDEHEEQEKLKDALEKALDESVARHKKNVEVLKQYEGIE
jgi:hypothetical protein